MFKPNPAVSCSKSSIFYSLLFDENRKLYIYFTHIKTGYPKPKIIMTQKNITYAYAGHHNSFIIDDNENAYECTNMPRVAFTQIKFPFATKFKFIVDTEFDKYFITIENDIYIQAKNNNKVTMLTPNFEIIQVTAGDHHVIFLATNNKVYAYGSNHYGQLGLGNHYLRSTTKLIEIQDLSNKSIVNIAAGKHHSIFLNQDNKAYVCGNNKFGPLGVGDYKDRIFPTLVKLPHNRKIKNIAAGGFQSSFLISKNEVYGCGNNICSQLGIISNKLYYNKPILIAFFNNKKIVQVECGWNQTFFTDNHGKIYSCGAAINKRPTLIPYFRLFTQKKSEVTSQNKRRRIFQ